MPDRPARSRLRSLAAFHPLLFAAYPVLYLWSQNLTEVRPTDALPALAVLVIGAAVATWVLGRMLGDARRGALIVSPAVFGLMMYGHVGTYAARLHIPGFIQQLGWAALVVVGVVLAVRLGAPWLGRLDTFLDRIAAILVAVTLVLIVPFEVSTATTTAAPAPTPSATAPLANDTSAPKRDVYYLVMDRYGSDLSLDLRFGSVNRLTPWLRDHGFTVLEDSHANYVRTALSMVTTLNVGHLPDLGIGNGPTDPRITPIYAHLQGPWVARQFQALGYRYLHVGSWWEPTRIDPTADVNFSGSGLSDFAHVLLQASAIPAIAKRVGVEGVIPVSDRDRKYRNTVYALDALEGIVDEPGPKFVLAHLLLPHPPYVFDRDGRYIPAAEARRLSEDELHQRQLDHTNAWLQAFFERLQALPEAERPIIILQADEGPYTDEYWNDRNTFDWYSAADEVVEIKFGIMNAWYLPGGEDLGLYPEMTAINTFPVLFGRYFGLDYGTLPDRVYTSRAWNRPYDLIDVTDRLPSLRP